MGYNKFIISGKLFELYEYEKDLRPKLGNRKKTGKYEVTAPTVSLVATEQNDREGGGQGKRQDNARIARMAFTRIVLSNLGEPPFPLLFTLTYAENITSLKQGYSDFNAFVRSLRYRFGQSFKYIAVPEFQERGAVHFHALFWGLPKQDSLFRSERDTRLLATMWRKGFLFLKQTDGNERLSNYLAKYMQKAFLSPLLAGQKAYTCSRNIARPICGSGFDSVWVVLAEWELSTTPPLLLKSFESQWLGRGRYSQYNIT